MTVKWKIPIATKDEYYDKLEGLSGVYCYVDKQSRALYIGKSENLKNRLENHSYGFGIEPKIPEVTDILIFVTENITEIEKKLIGEYDPPYNKKSLSSYSVGKSVRVTVHLPRELLRKLRLYAAEHDMRLSEVVERLIDKNL